MTNKEKFYRLFQDLEKEVRNHDDTLESARCIQQVIMDLDYAACQYKWELFDKKHKIKSVV